MNSLQRVLLGLGLGLAILGCGSPKSDPQVTNPTPAISALVPSTLPAGSAAQTLTISGTNFLPSSTATFNGIAHAVTFTSSTQVGISLSASDLAAQAGYPANLPVVITNPAPEGGASNAYTFVLTAPDNKVPTVSSLSPASVVVGSAAQVLTVTGSNFLPASTISFNGVVHAATYVSATKLTIPLTAADQATLGSYPVVVTNPAPGGGTSTPVSFSVVAAMPSIMFFGATPATIVSGGSSTLSWKVLNAASSSINQSLGDVSSQTSIDVTPTSTTTYTLTASGAGGATVTATAILTVHAAGGSALWHAPGNYNPVVPGYFADATLKKFGDTYYLYPTSDAVYEAGGEPSVWISKDFVNWSNLLQDPNTGTYQWWAPDVIYRNGNYYIYQGNDSVSIFGAVSSTPIGPWTNLKTTAGTPVLPNFNGNTISGFSDIDKVITLDGQTFVDDDGTVYMYFCTWATNPGSGCGWVKLTSTMDDFSRAARDHGMIPNTQATNVFEGPFMLKRNTTYYLMYSSNDCHTDTYNVEYATGASATGTFTFGKKILATNADDSVDGPGHHSVYDENGTYYIVYHRHNNPHDNGGMSRQECVDVMTFDDTKTPAAINTVTPTHEGVSYLGDSANWDQTVDLCYGKTATASSYYMDTARNWAFLPKFAVDANNATLWKAGDSHMGHWLQVDLGSVQTIARTMVEFEFPIYYYQYKIEYSTDGSAWQIYADRTANRKPGCPLVDVNNVSARYLKITITGVQKPGLMAAIWNFKAYGTIGSFAPVENADSTVTPASATRGKLLINLDASALSTGSLTAWPNEGTLGGSFAKESGSPIVETKAGKQAVTFDGATRFKATAAVPDTLAWNSPFTVSTWVYNPAVGNAECLLAWGTRNGPTASYAALMYCTAGGGLWSAAAHWGYADFGFKTIPSAGAWHHLALVYDGVVEHIYVDGVLDHERHNILNVKPNAFYLGDSTANEFLSGSIASLRVYDVAVDLQGVKDLMNGREPSLPQAPK